MTGEGLRVIPGEVIRHEAPWEKPRVRDAILGNENGLGFTQQEFDSVTEIIEDVESMIREEYREFAERVFELFDQFVAETIDSTQFDQKMKDIFFDLRSEEWWRLQVQADFNEQDEVEEPIPKNTELVYDVYEAAELQVLHDKKPIFQRLNEMISSLRSFGLL